jgi:hypothetical protein
MVVSGARSRLLALVKHARLHVVERLWPRRDVGGLRQDAHMSESSQRYWDEQAATLDEEADHGLREPAVRGAWAELLLPLLPAVPAQIVDLAAAQAACRC